MFHFLFYTLHRSNLVFFLSSGMNAILPTRDPSMPMPLSKACGALTKSSDELSSGLRCLETTRLRVYRVSGGRYLYRGQSLRSCCVRMQLGCYLFLDFFIQLSCFDLDDTQSCSHYGYFYKVLSCRNHNASNTLFDGK